MIECLRTYDIGYCYEILGNPDIFDAISEDEAKLTDVKVDVLNDYWVMIIDGDIDIGVAQFKHSHSRMWDAHIHILPERRKDYAQLAGKKLWDWVECNLKDSLIYTAVPEFCKSVKLFLLGFDFEEVGTLKGAWLKNGERHNMTILTRGVN